MNYFVFFFLLYSELVSCQAVSVNNSVNDSHKSKRVQYHYIELCLQLQDALKRPRVRCTNEDMAQKATRHVSSNLCSIFTLPLSIQFQIYLTIKHIFCSKFLDKLC